MASSYRSNLQTNQPPYKLIHLCADIVVKYASITKIALNVLPAELFPALLDASLRELRVLPLSMLISHWPLAQLTYNKYNVYPTIQHLPLVYGILSHLIAANIDNFTRKNSKLKVIDLRGITIDPNGMLTFVKAIMQTNQHPCHHHLTLSFDDDQLRRKYTQTDHALTNEDQVHPKPSTKRLKLAHQLQFFLECHVDTNNYHEIGQLLRMENARIDVHITSLRCQEIGCKKILSLLRLLKPDEITMLNLDFNDLGGKYFSSLTNQLQHCLRLTTLNVAYNNLTRIQITLLSKSLLYLKSLKHLNLSGNRLNSLLRQLLANLTHSVEILKLNYCCLTNRDLFDLAESQQHCQHLSELHLESNNLAQKLESVKCLLSRTINLKTVKLSDNGIDQGIFISLCHTAPSIQHVLCKWNEEDTQQDHALP
ncbi:uncharacterized protein TRIADDRAFT_55619 [Trichoplax adhaerens]|uniref:Leucine-rich repeat-containing protein 14 n=1 Tax=Trichoplax adhaerens TaxID=10228 RepID=B3RVE0_TRIAD|nr:hypothetical protein TRIADDRAFT_55619 [Trichoplax adhaerens]EDV25485.1 hypothetical protein TRIADDRAFT_55619 [Trichoplax adhaerens]|eukprot:XP_002111518.1 hypothetical protein TRIADDRAFT_55619 [Trichoplax adhaerens]